ncbi:MAG: hypothetical protein A2Y56_16105 [Candidatus Aminicenantes bacterium RBG_13_63_10]|nr:MAG: hypothetical protein A2Y56_16105 [Candidatus Aminicenantes bacterium RBG_13_63_10]
MNKFARFLVSFGPAALAFLLIFNFPASRLHSQGLEIINPPWIGGWVIAYPNADTPALSASISISRSGTPIPSLIVRIDDTHNLTETRPGNYYATDIAYPSIPFNMPLKISIKSRLRTDPEIFADGRVSALVEFISPKPGTVIDLRTSAFVKVQWKYTAGSAAVERIMLIKEGTGGGIDFTGIGAATSYEIPRDRLAPNSSYRLLLVVKLNDFKFKDARLVASRSIINLYIYIYTSFRTAP